VNLLSDVANLWLNFFNIVSLDESKRKFQYYKGAVQIIYPKRVPQVKKGLTCFNVIGKKSLQQAKKK
jgi:hypothetical protein